MREVRVSLGFGSGFGVGCGCPAICSLTGGNLVGKAEIFFPRRVGIGAVHPVMGMVGCSPPFSFLVPIGAFDSSAKGVVVGKLAVP